jgi:hypothetical protein
VKDEDVKEISPYKTEEFLEGKTAPWSTLVSEDAPNDVGTLIVCHCPSLHSSASFTFTEQDISVGETRFQRNSAVTSQSQASL